MFYTNLDDTSMVKNPIIIPLLTSTIFYPLWNKTQKFSLILKLKEQEKYNNCSNISTGQEHQTLDYIYNK